MILWRFFFLKTMFVYSKRSATISTYFHTCQLFHSSIKTKCYCLLTNNKRFDRPIRFSHVDPINWMTNWLMRQSSISWKLDHFLYRNYMKRNPLNWLRFPNEIAWQFLPKTFAGLLLIFYTALGNVRSCWCTHYYWSPHWVQTPKHFRLKTFFPLKKLDISIKTGSPQKIRQICIVFFSFFQIV